MQDRLPDEIISLGISPGSLDKQPLLVSLCFASSDQRSSMGGLLNVNGEESNLALDLDLRIPLFVVSSGRALTGLLNLRHALDNRSHCLVVGRVLLMAPARCCFQRSRAGRHNR